MHYLPYRRHFREEESAPKSGSSLIEFGLAFSNYADIVGNGGFRPCLLHYVTLAAPPTLELSMGTSVRRSMTRSDRQAALNDAQTSPG